MRLRDIFALAVACGITLIAAFAAQKLDDAAAPPALAIAGVVGIVVAAAGAAALVFGLAGARSQRSVGHSLKPAVRDRMRHPATASTPWAVHLADEQLQRLVMMAVVNRSREISTERKLSELTEWRNAVSHLALCAHGVSISRLRFKPEELTAGDRFRDQLNQALQRDRDLFGGGRARGSNALAL